MAFEEVTGDEEPKMTRFQAAEARTDFVRPSEAIPAPVDREGISLITNEQLGAIIGRSKGTSRHLSYSGLPQYKKKGEEWDDKNSRTFYSLGEVVKHLRGRLKAEPHLQDMHDKIKAVHLDESARVTKERAATGEAFDINNQPHPGNKEVRLESFPNGRPFTVDAPDLPNKELMATGYSSDLTNPRKHGHMKVVEPTIRESRSQRRAKR